MLLFANYVLIIEPHLIFRTICSLLCYDLFHSPFSCYLINFSILLFFIWYLILLIYKVVDWLILRDFSCCNWTSNSVFRLTSKFTMFSLLLNELVVFEALLVCKFILLLLLFFVLQLLFYSFMNFWKVIFSFFWVSFPYFSGSLIWLTDEAISFSVLGWKISFLTYSFSF